jgi:tetratricopeptide (TPR) repeat protein
MEAIRRRLDRLSERCNQVLTVASVIGREFELRLLERLEGDSSARSGQKQSGEEILEAVEEALAARVIEELPQAVGRFQFSHVLIQDTLAQELSAVRRARLHQRIAEALEELYEDKTETRASELAYHYAEAAAVTGTEKLVRYSLLAGERALATYAHEEALTHFQRALEAKEGQPVDAETAVLLFGLGRAQLATRERYQTQEAVINLRRAFDYYAEVGDVDRAVAVAEYPVRATLGVTVGEAELIRRALALVSPDSRQAGRLLSAYGLSLYQETGDYEGAQEAFGRALDIAQREEDLALEIRTLANATDVDFHHLRWPEGVEKGLRAIALTSRVDDPQCELIASFYIMRALDNMGNLERAQQHGAAARRAAERLRHREWLVQVYGQSGALSQRTGDWPAARAFTDRALAAAAGSSQAYCHRTVLEHMIGDFDQGRVHLERLLDATNRFLMGAGFA